VARIVSNSWSRTIRKNSGKYSYGSAGKGSELPLAPYQALIQDAPGHCSVGTGPAFNFVIAGIK